jgi:ERCC4-type nuclease
MSLKEQQEYIVSALPGVGMTLAKPMLEKFGSIKNIVNADFEALKEIDKIGEKRAKEIQKVLGDEYKKNQN